MDARATALHHAFVGAFRPYLKAIMGERDYPMPPDDLLVSAESWLDSELERLLETPYTEQRRSPLELFQEAFAGPTEWISEQGIPAPLRDPAAVAALPGDTYALAPASSAALGEDVFHAHLAWGAAKAEALAPAVNRPSVVVVSGDLMDRSRFDEAGGASRLSVLHWSGIEDDYSNAVMAFVDMKHADAEHAIVRFSNEGLRTVAYGPHVDEAAMERARLLGADATVSRSKLFKSLAAYLPQET